MDPISSVSGSGSAPALLPLPEPSRHPSPAPAQAVEQRAPVRTSGVMVHTSAEIAIDPDTHAVTVTVRNAESNEVLLRWPLGRLVEAAPNQGYPPGLVFQAAG